MSIEVFDVDLGIFGAGIYYYHPYDVDSSSGAGAIKFNGNDYLPAPITTEGFEITTKGMPTPQITIGNVMGQIGGLVKLYDGLVGATVTRTILTQAPPDYEFTNADVLGLPDVYVLDRPTNHTRKSITFDLKSIFEMNGSKLPRRTILQDNCPWVYKSAQCGYIGNLPTCKRNTADCIAHFGQGNPLNFGGFPGVDRVG